MRIRSVFKSGLWRTSPPGIKEMAFHCDCAGLIDILDKVNQEHIPLVLAYLTDLSERGWYDRIISYGAIPKVTELMHHGPFLQKKNAVFLISSLITHGRCEIVLSNDGIIDGMVNLLNEEDEDLTRCITYCISMYCTTGAAEVLIDAGGIEMIGPHVTSDDIMTVYYCLYTLGTLSSMGYQEEILGTGVDKKIDYHMSGNTEIASLSKLLLDDLYNWKEESFCLEDDELEILPDNMEEIGVNDGYFRPLSRKQRIEPRDGSILGYDGNEIRKEEDEEVIVVLKKRKIEGIVSGSLDDVSSEIGSILNNEDDLLHRPTDASTEPKNEVPGSMEQPEIPIT